MLSVEIIKDLSDQENIINDIFLIEQAVFGKKSFSKEILASDMNDSEVILCVLKENSKIIGFAYALPEDKDTSCIVDIAIIKEYQGKGLVGMIMSYLEAELRRSGYHYMIEYAMVDNGYADKIEANYSSRIIEKRNVVGDYGKQRYFKIML